MKSKNIVAIVTHSLGELDILLPLVSALRKEYVIKLDIIFAVEKIYKQFMCSKFYAYCIKDTNCKVTFLRLPNKFDSKFRQLMVSSIGSIFLKIYFKLLLFWNLPRLIYKLIRADFYMHEVSNQLLSTRPLYWFNRLLKKRIFVYHHGHGITIDSKVSTRVTYAERVWLLLFHEHNKEYMNKLGFINQYRIGYPKFYKEWINLVKNYNSSKFEGKEIVLIYSRHVHSYYMDKDKYFKLFTSAYRIIRKKMGDIPIVIKPHPRENTELIAEIIKQEELSNIFISWEHPAVLAKSAKLSIALWSSAILDSLSLGVPSIEYYIEADRFREAEPEGSAYKKVGIHSVDNEWDLENFVGKVLDGGYKIPSIIHEISKVKDVGFLS